MGGMVETARMTRSSGFDLHEIEVAVGLDMGLPGIRCCPPDTGPLTARRGARPRRDCPGGRSVHDDPGCWAAATGSRMALRSAIAVESRVRSWKPSTPASRQVSNPKRQSGRERNLDYVRPWRVQPSIDRTDAVLDRQCIRSRRPRRTRRGRNRPQERRSRWGSSHHPGTRQAPSAYGVAGASRWRQFAASPGCAPELVPWVLE
jgi:hypothetical protein